MAEVKGLPETTWLLNKLLGVEQTTGRLDPDVGAVSSPPPTPTLASSAAPSFTSKVLKTPPPPKEQSEIYINTVDSKGKPITVFSTTGELKTENDFAKALDNFDQGKPTAGFVVLPGGSTQERIRRGFEAVNQPLQTGAPQVGGALGAIAGTSPLGILLEKTGVLPKGTTSSAAAPMRTGGEAIGRLLAEQVNTPEKAAMALGTGVASRAMLPVVNAAGQFLKVPAAVNVLMAGTTAGSGATLARAATGGESSPAHSLEDFAVAGLSGLTPLASYFITKFVNKNMQEKVAKEVVDTFKQRYPNVNIGNNAMNIAGSSVGDIEALTAQMSKGLRGTASEVNEEILNTLKNSLPSGLTQGQQVSLRGYIRRLVTAQNKQLDSIGSQIDFDDAGNLVTQRTQELLEAAQQMFPKVKNLPTARVALERYNSELSRFQDGAKVLHYLKEAGAEGGYDPLKFAQLIRGKYQSDPGSQLEAVGNILGQGRPLTQMPHPGQPDPLSNMGAGAYNAARSLLPSWLRPGRMPAQLPQVPWEARQLPMQPLVNFGAQEGGQAAIRSFLEGGRE